MAQNTSHAVMSQRTESPDSLDDFPTPPWAIRAFVEHVLGGKATTGGLHVLEPACGRGYMSSALAEYFGEVTSSDIFDYEFAGTRDFLNEPRKEKSVDWMITNPPFKAAEAFVDEGLKVANVGVAILTRTVFIESMGRYERLFSKRPPTIVAQYVERVPIVKGRLDKSASTATGYCWLVWSPLNNAGTELVWIPPSRKQFEREADYSGATGQLDLEEGEKKMIEQLREELEADEGLKYEIYLDHLGLKTCGVGHLCKEGDPELEMEVGAPVSEERVAELFEKDIAWTLDDCQKLIPDFDMLPKQVQLIVANMCFNLGINRLGRFLKLLEAIEDRDWKLAADEMLDSKWARQVPARSGRLIARMRALAPASRS